MPTIYNQMLGFWRDATGATATTFTTALDQSASIPGQMSALMAAWSEISDAALDGVAWQQAAVMSNDPGDGEYLSVADRATFLLNYVGSPQGSRIEVVAPKQDIFLPGNRLVDMTDSRVVAFVAALMAAAGDRTGREIREVTQGHRQMVKRGPF